MPVAPFRSLALGADRVKTPSATLKPLAAGGVILVAETRPGTEVLAKATIPETTPIEKSFCVRFIICLFSGPDGALKHYDPLRHLSIIRMVAYFPPVVKRSHVKILFPVDDCP